MRQAIILAAGEGQRLKPFTIERPKAMLSIADKPIIHYVLESLAINGIRNIVIIVGYQKEQIFDYVGDGKKFGVEIKYINQDQRLGTAYALNLARVEAENEFLVLHGNKLITPETIAKFVSVEPQAILIKKVENPSRYGVVNMKAGKLASIVEKPEHSVTNFVNTGIYAFTNKVFSYTESELDIPVAINKMLVQGETINLIETDKLWLDVVYPWDILNLNSVILKNQKATQNGIIEDGVYLNGNVSIGESTIIRSNTYIMGPVVIGKGCEIGPNVCLFPSTTIGDNVIISSFSEVRNSVIGNDVHIAPLSTIQDSVIDDGSIIGSHFSTISEEVELKVNEEHHIVKVGSMVGTGCRIDNAVTSQAGTIIGNYSKVKSFKLLTGTFPDRSLVF
jgi:UDP-N-acetylglucosamine diphosphorylase / glucose-1-phosphate thymidylyltransferase / UDP-N-acetylgalactosamine diphosphorylase / glucosamine-1-phosphate N-acetyltransferase / galactosamine-1-phosphate N-acetyltransferase